MSTYKTPVIWVRSVKKPRQKPFPVGVNWFEGGIGRKIQFIEVADPNADEFEPLPKPHEVDASFSSGNELSTLVDDECVPPDIQAMTTKEAKAAIDGFLAKDQLEAIKQQEYEGKNRKSVKNYIDERISQL